MKIKLVLFFFLLTGFSAFSQNIPRTNCNDCWNPDSLGNHRAVVQFSGTGKVAKVMIPWRRRDYHPELWSEPTDITLQVNRIHQPEINPDWNFKEDWRTYANTPGHALKFQQGKYKGRIYVAANHSSGDPKPELRDYKAHAYYTDDHAAELMNNSLLMNSRNQTGKYRIISLNET